MNSGFIDDDKFAELQEEGLILDVNSRKYAVLRSVTSMSQSISLLLRGTFPMIKP